MFLIGGFIMDRELKELINELTEITTLTEEWVIKLYKQEFKECGNAEEAARRVRRRVDFYMV
jgi:hypothetical protein